ncbi:esterase/lipase family protein [Marmoricola sp. RAF53]|uniref:esterase/lipase family protein n=1 Tax=Marmoricola sp. RAF53 TaxID=3233059 RepID=UPI003F9650D3
MRVPALVTAALLALTGGLIAAPAHADDAPGPWAPLDRPGPALTVSEAAFRSAFTCSGDLAGSTLEPVLLSPATGVTAAQNYSWNWEPALTAQGRPWCAVTMPTQTLGDIQVSAEYLVHAIRAMHAAAGRQIAVLGHSQGGMSMRWALRFWPDTRAMVDDVIGMAGDNHGTTLLDPVCVQGLTTCAPQGWQQRSRSAFVAALNSGAETFAGVSYTEIYTRTDEVVLPSTGAKPSSALTTGAGRITNVATQSVCPLDLDEHLTVGTIDPVTYALAQDALNHDGPADPARINRSVCLSLLMPGVNPLALDRNLALLGGLPHVLLVPVPFVNLAGAPQLAAEPPVRCYALAAGCP